MRSILYTDEELKLWWENKAHCAQTELLDKMIDVTDSEFARSLKTVYEQGRPFSPKQLEKIRKWDR